MDKTRLLAELDELRKLREQVEKSLQNAPSGSIRSEMAQGKYPQYYMKSDEYADKYPKGKYLKKSQIEIARQLVQKEYDDMMLKELKKREKEIRFILTISGGNGLKDVYEKLPLAKRCLVHPYILSDDEFAQRWKDADSDVKNTYPITNGFVTENGELVRSKSEKIIADKLFYKNILYKYEKGLVINNKVMFPDFTILNVKKREEVYYEHFGMMDQPEYCKSALERIEQYENNGILLGERLFVTFECSQKAVNLKQLDLLIDRMV